MIYGAITLTVLFAVYVFSGMRRPWPTESDLSHRLFFYFKFYYSTKYLSPVRFAERNSGLEKYFSAMQKPHYTEDLQNVQTLQIKAVGDLMVRRDLAAPASPHLWTDVEEYLFDGDLVSGNLEFAVNPNHRIYQIIRYSVEEKYTEPILDRPRGTFDYLSIANNHIYDSYRNGVCYTRDFLAKRGIPFSGASDSVEERDNFPVIDVKGVKIALLAYTFTTNGIRLRDDFRYGVNLIRFNALREKDYDPSLIEHHITLAKQRGADLIMANNHWGIEFEYYPSSRLVRRAHALMDAGIDIIIGHHPHILNPAEWYDTADGRTAFCAYSLGNIISYALKQPIMNLAEIVGITVEVGENSSGERVVRLKEAEFMPTWFHKKGRGGRSDHRILSLSSLRDGAHSQRLSPIDRRSLAYVSREYDRFFRQDRAFLYR
ncbi:MAG: CapA family protein [Fibrobacterota bacterium]